MTNGSFGIVGKMFTEIQNSLWWVTARIKSYHFLIKIIAAPNPPYN
ncbi:hypothetical protein [Gloeothece verrucosa]|nr:hypothetical protein [Gloeothece verrucosa]